MCSKPSHSVFFQCFPFAISELSTLYSQTTILSHASYYFQENRASVEKNFPRLEKLFSTLEKIFSRHEKKFSSPSLIFENKLSLFNMANAFHISPPPRCKKRCASLYSPMGNVAHAHGQRTGTVFVSATPRLVSSHRMRKGC